MLGGLAVGAASILAPAYVSEVTPTNMRGYLSNIQQTVIIGAQTAKQKIGEIKASLAQDHAPKLSDLADQNNGRVRKIK